MDRLTGRTEEVEISGRDALCRFEPTLYWLVKDLAKGRENPYSAYWCGINADEDAAALDRDWREDGPREVCVNEGWCTE